MNAIAFDDVNAAQLRKLAHTRPAVRRKPWTPTPGRIAFAARLDRQCGTQYCVDLIISERLRFAHLDFLWHLNAPAHERVARDELFIHRQSKHRPSRANPYIGDGAGGPVGINESV